MTAAHDIAGHAEPRLRIAHNVSALAQEASGPSYSVVRLCEGLRAADHAVTLLTLDWEPGTVLPPFARSFPLAMGPRRLGRSPAMLDWLQTEARHGQLDLIHTHGLWMMTNVYPGWVARVDGKPVKIFKANQAFRAIPVEAGTHEVVWSFEPLLFKIGVAVSLLVLLFLLVYYMRLLSPRRRGSECRPPTRAFGGDITRRMTRL